MRTQATMAMVLALIAGATTLAQAGGRARVVVSGAPRQVVAGQRFDLGIQVIPQGWSHRRDVQPRVVAQCGDRKVTASAVSMAKANAYRATLALPAAGGWTLRVDSRYCETVMTPLEVQAVATPAKR